MDWNQMGSMNRRNFIKTASAAGVSASSLYWGTQNGLAAAANKDEVPYVKFLHGTPEPAGNGRRPIYDSIPREEWERRWTAVDLRDKTGRQLNKKYDTDLISPEFTSMDSSHTGFGVKVVYTRIVQDEEVVRSPDVSFEDVKEEFEGSGTGEAAKGEYRAVREDIPILVTQRRERKTGCSESDVMNQITIDGIPAGVDMTAVDEGSGSLCAPFYRSDYGEGWIVSGHVVGGLGGGAAGTVVKQGALDSEEKIGEVRDSQVTSDIDWAYVEDSVSGKYTVEEVAQEDDMTSTDYKIGGIVNDDTLVNKEGTSEVFYTQAEQTSRLSNTIINVGGIGNSYVVSGHDTTDGDSGGILFDVGDNDYYAYVAGVIRSEVNDNDSDDCNDDVKSTTAETTENKANGSFMAY